MSRKPSPRGSQAAPGFFSLRDLINIIKARSAMTRPSQNGMKAGPGPPEPHHW